MMVDRLLADKARQCDFTDLAGIEISVTAQSGRAVRIGFTQ
jgi:hypothetical protein